MRQNPFCKLQIHLVPSLLEQQCLHPHLLWCCGCSQYKWDDTLLRCLAVMGCTDLPPQCLSVLNGTVRKELRGTLRQKADAALTSQVLELRHRSGLRAVAEVHCTPCVRLNLDELRL